MKVHWPRYWSLWTCLKQVPALVRGQITGRKYHHQKRCLLCGAFCRSAWNHEETVVYYDRYACTNPWCYNFSKF